MTLLSIMLELISCNKIHKIKRVTRRTVDKTVAIITVSPVTSTITAIRHKRRNMHLYARPHRDEQ